MINYEHIVPAFVGPKLAYHGFKYDEKDSYPPQGDFVFSRSYWCKTQKVSIGPIDYDLEDAKDVISRGEDFPTEIPRELLLIREPGFRRWLSNRYLAAVLHCERGSVTLIPNLGIITPDTRPGLDQSIGILRMPELNRRLPTWWEFHGEDNLRRTLNSIVSIIVSQGLDWFEEDVVDIKRYHQKLERRR